MERSAFEKIVNEHGKDILRFCRLTAGSKDFGDELYQDTMLTLIERIEKLDASMNVKGYAISTALLLYKNKKRKYARRQRILPLQSMDGLADNKPEPAIADTVSLEDEIINRQEIMRVRKAVRKLPDKYRNIVLMHYSADMSMREISETLHIPVGTVKTRMQKAREILKEILT